MPYCHLRERASTAWEPYDGAGTLGAPAQHSHHQVCLFTKICHTAFVVVTFLVTPLKTYLLLLKFLIYIIKVFVHCRILHLLYYINCETIRTVKTINLFYNYFATIQHLSCFCWSVSLFLFMVQLRTVIRGRKPWTVFCD
jgi:hypothetical protein